MISNRRTEKYIWVTDRFEGFHAYKDAPDEVAFLKNLHRHVFHVKMTIQVKHDDRELEFFMVKQHYEREIKPFIQLAKDLGSCEMIAQRILDGLANTYGDDRFYSVEVSEDGENGATVLYER